MTDYPPIVTPSDDHQQPAHARLALWQRITVALLVAGYAGYYLCRSHFSVAKPLLLHEFHGHGLDKAVLGDIAFYGTLAYALGKFVSGSLADFAGGRRMFLTGMAGAILFSVFFGLSGTVPLFTLAWMGNRLIQSMGWGGLTKMTARWFSFSTYGTVMGFLCLSYLFGDFLSRQFLAQLIAWHFGWRQLFFIAAGVLAVIFLVTVLLLKESPLDVGAEEPPPNPGNLFGSEGTKARPQGLADLLLPLLRSPRFWLVCTLSFGFTVLRETFNDWTPTYLNEIGRMSVADAGRASSYFPLFGGISVLFFGWLSDRLGTAGRAAIIFCGLALVTPALYALSIIKPESQVAAILMLGGIGVATLGPYAFLAGAIALDFGGKKGSATAAGWIDGVGYIGGSLIAGKTIGKIAETQGWKPAFLLLTLIAAGSCVAAGLYWAQQAAASKRARVTAADLASSVGDKPADENL